jgi:hypothetical protein
VRIDNNSRHIYVRQSWFGDYMICPERARFAIVNPNFRSGSDATAIGTGIHAGIEWALGHDSLDAVDFDQLCEYSQEQVALELEKPIKRTKISDVPEDIPVTVSAMVGAWFNEIAPNVKWGGQVERKFRFPSGQVAQNGYEIWFEGTVDYLEPDGGLWDWKTAARPYNGREKQEKAYQATVYCQWAHHAEVSMSQTQQFLYGVMIRNKTPKAQIVEVERDQRHYDWLNRQVKTIVDNALMRSEHASWPMNDQHTLCSSTWCDYWSICKGAVV